MASSNTQSVTLRIPAHPNITKLVQRYFETHADKQNTIYIDRNLINGSPVNGEANGKPPARFIPFSIPPGASVDKVFNFLEKYGVDSTEAGIMVGSFRRTFDPENKGNLDASSERSELKGKNCAAVFSPDSNIDGDSEHVVLIQSPQTTVTRGIDIQSLKSPKCTLSGKSLTLEKSGGTTISIPENSDSAEGHELKQSPKCNIEGGKKCLLTKSGETTITPDENDNPASNHNLTESPKCTIEGGKACTLNKSSGATITTDSDRNPAEEHSLTRSTNCTLEGGAKHVVVKSSKSRITGGKECELIDSKESTLDSCTNVKANQSQNLNSKQTTDAVFQLSPGCIVTGCEKIDVRRSQSLTADNVSILKTDSSPFAVIDNSEKVLLHHAGGSLAVQENKSKNKTRLFISDDDDKTHIKDCKAPKKLRAKVAKQAARNKWNIVLIKSQGCKVNDSTLLIAAGSSGLEATNCSDILAENSKGLKITDCHGVKFVNCHGEYSGLKNRIVIDDEIQPTFQEKWATREGWTGEGTVLGGWGSNISNWFAGKKDFLVKGGSLLGSFFGGVVSIFGYSKNKKTESQTKQPDASGEDSIFWDPDKDFPPYGGDLEDSSSIGSDVLSDSDFNLESPLEHSDSDIDLAEQKKPSDSDSSDDFLL